MKYRDYNDYELINLIQGNIEEAKEILYEKYLPVIKTIVNKWYIQNKNLGIDRNDLIQEGLVGLNKAIDHFKESKDTKFYTYSVHCIENQINDFITASKRLKYRVLNEALPVDIVSIDGEYKLLDFLKTTDNDPATLLFNKEEEDDRIKNLKDNLTDLENQVFDLKYQGFSIKEISTKLNYDYRTIDNALQRIKTKLRKILNK